jgi:putative ABC transport system permease protein
VDAGQVPVQDKHVVGVEAELEHGVGAVVAAAIALPAELITQDHLVRQLASGTALHGAALPGSFVQVLGGTGLLLLALGGLAIAVAGALGPATWAARTRTSAVLHME